MSPTPSVPPILPGSPEAPEAKKFNKTEALNTKGFPQFLAAFKDKSIDATDADIETRFEAFSKLGETTNKLRELYQNEIKSELGIELSKEDLECMDDYLEAQAIEDPESVGNIAKQMEDYKASNDQIKALEQELGALEASSGYTEAVNKEGEFEQNTLEVLGKSGFLSMTGIRLGYVLEFLSRSGGENTSFLAMRKEVVNKAGGSSADELGKAIDESRERVAALTEKLKTDKEVKAGEIEQAKKDMATLKFGLFGLDGLQGDIANKIAEKISSNVSNLLNKGDIMDKNKLNNLNAAGDLAQKASSKAGENSLGIDYSAELALKTSADFAGDVEKTIQRTTIVQMSKAFKEVKLGAKPWDSMKKAFDKYSALQKVGSAEGPEAKALIISQLTRVLESIQNAYERSGNKNKDLGAKAIILQQMLNDATA